MFPVRSALFRLLLLGSDETGRMIAGQHHPSYERLLMFRISLPRRRRLGALLTAGVLLATPMVIGSPSVQATAGVVDLETTALRLSGGPITAGGVIPADVTLTPVNLATADPETSFNDGANLIIPRPQVRIPRSRVVIPASAGEDATFRIDGMTVASRVPEFRVVTLQTDQGEVRAAIFTVGGVTYAIPRQGDLVPGVTRTVATTRVVSMASDLSTTQYGLLPVGAQPRTGSMFRVAAFTGATSIITSTVYDADNVRGNSDALGEERLTFGPETEVLATLTLSNGATVAVQGLRFATPEPYGGLNTSWAFDRAALAAAGATIADVTGVVSFAVVAHDLTWQDLGFDLI